MTNEEFSNEFDILYNSITSNQAPGLDNYEKSVFLNIALELIIKSYFDPKANKLMEGMDGSKRRLLLFAKLISTVTLNNKYSVATNTFVIPDDILVILNEEVTNHESLTNDKYGDVTGKYTVVPITYVLYDSLMQKPYPYPPKRLVWRLFIYTDIAEEVGLNNAPAAKLIGNLNNPTYTIRYVKKPTPFNLEGTSSDEACELDSSLHREILQRAVELAKAAYIGDLSTLIALGSSSQTEIGYIPQANNK